MPLYQFPSSYTPSIKTLGYAHRRAHTMEGTQASLLIATMPTTPAGASHSNIGKLCDLPGVTEEEKRVTELLAGNIPVQSLNSPSVAQVIDKMRDCTIAHFACHGSTDHVYPSNSSLILQRQGDQGLKQDRLTARRFDDQSEHQRASPFFLYSMASIYDPSLPFSVHGIVVRKPLPCDASSFSEPVPKTTCRMST